MILEISPFWKNGKKHVSHKLSDLPDVFSHHSLDFGCTDRARHSIKLHAETLLKHCARAIHPHDIEVVRSHLRDLLDTGVIRELESLFSSPIV